MAKTKKSTKVKTATVTQPAKKQSNWCCCGVIGAIVLLLFLWLAYQSLKFFVPIV
jgi:hypothetical protein